MGVKNLSEDARRPDWGSELDPEDFRPLTATEAKRWRQHQAVDRSIERALMVQAVLGLLAVAITGLWAGRLAACSVAYGVLVVMFPLAVAVAWLRPNRVPGGAGGLLMGFVVWEVVKLGLSLLLLLSAPWLLGTVVWPALLAGLIVGLKSYGVVLLRRARP